MLRRPRTFPCEVPNKEARHRQLAAPSNELRLNRLTPFGRPESDHEPSSNIPFFWDLPARDLQDGTGVSRPKTAGR